MSEKLYVKCPMCDGKGEYPQSVRTYDDMIQWHIQDSKMLPCPNLCDNGYLPATPEQIVAAASQHALDILLGDDGSATTPEVEPKGD